MAQSKYRVDLASLKFPLLSSDKGRTVVSPASEEVYHKQDNKPHMYFCENVMPYAEGYQSVSFVPFIEEAVSAPTRILLESDDILLLENNSTLLLTSGITISDVRTIYSQEGYRVHLVWDDNGDVYALNSGESTWDIVIDAPVVPGTFTVEDITIGTVNGTSYIFYKQQGIYTYDVATNTFTEETIVGLTVTDIICILASNGYLIAITTVANFWSSLLDPLDFTPSQITGAGGGAVADIDGIIKFGAAHSSGYILYTEANAVSASYTGNKQYPFKFREVIGSRGGISLDLLAYEANSGSHFIFTTGGLQSISATAADTILPEVTDFLSGYTFEEFDPDVNGIVKTVLTTSMRKKVKLISSRYLVISYGISEFTHALIYDIVLDRLGKVAILHSDVFEYLGAQDNIAKQNICFLLDSGEAKYLDFTSGNGTLLVGKLQHSRSRITTLLQVEVETAKNITLFDLPSLDGKVMLDAVEGTELYSNDGIAQFGFFTSAKNHNILVLGDFSMNTMEVTYMNSGRR